MKTAEAMAIRTIKANRNILGIIAPPVVRAFRQLGDIGSHLALESQRARAMLCYTASNSKGGTR